MDFNSNDLRNKLVNKSGTVDTFMYEAQNQQMSSRREKERKLLEELGNERPKMSKSKKVAIGTAVGLIGAAAIGVPTAKYLVDNQKHIVTMKVQGVHYETYRLEVKKGTLVKSLKAYSITGYNFIGFFKDEKCTIPYDEEEKVTKSSTVYCKYEPIVYVVNYVENDTEYVINSDSKVEYGNELIFTIYAKPGYTLDDCVVRINGVIQEPNELGQYVVGFVESDIEISIQNVREMNYMISLDAGDASANIAILDNEITLKDVLEENLETFIDLSILCNPNTYTKQELINLGKEDLYKLLVYGIYEDEACTKKLDLTKQVISYKVENIKIYTKLATTDKLKFADNYVSAKDTGISGELVIPQAYLKNGQLVEIKTTGRYGFQACTGLTSLKVPYGLTNIGYGSFFKCSNLSSMELPNSLIHIEEGSFCQTGLINVIVPDSVKVIDGYAFSRSSTIISVHLGAGLESLENLMFSRNPNMEKLTISDKNNKFHSAGNCIIETETKTLVLGCKTSVIPDDGSVQIIAGGSFSYIEGLVSIKIPNSIISLGKFAFNNCDELTDIEIGSGLASIVRSGFCECSNITNIKVDENNEVFYVAGNCLINRADKTLVLGSLYAQIPEDGSVTAIGIDSFRGVNITNIDIPDVIDSIGTQAFEKCVNLSEIIIPSSVAGLGTAVFAECDNLNIIIDEANETFKMAGNCLINKKTGELRQGFYNSVIPTDGSVTFIGNSAFYMCSNLKNITIPNTITKIGYYAFLNCTSLTEITIPSSVTAIDDLVFEGCKNLKKVIFEETEGWFVADTSDATTGTDIVSSNLANVGTAATYLTSTYLSKYWKRNIE